MSKTAGDRCECCKHVLPREGGQQRLVLVNGALVCPRCDVVEQWPNVKRGKRND